MLPDLAIDGPSEKMISFMHRNYGIEHLVRQNNNFAVVPGFFDHLESGARYCTVAYRTMFNVE